MIRKKLMKMMINLVCNSKSEFTYMAHILVYI